MSTLQHPPVIIAGITATTGPDHGTPFTASWRLAADGRILARVIAVDGQPVSGWVSSQGPIIPALLAECTANPDKSREILEFYARYDGYIPDGA